VELDLFPEWEFHTLMGLDRTDVAEILDCWPDPAPSAPRGYDTAEDAQLTAVNNVLNHLLGYPHGHRGDDFLRVVGVTELEVASALKAWREGAGLALGGKGAEGYFNRFM
jgi:hypothetical protein